MKNITREMIINNVKPVICNIKKVGKHTHEKVLDFAVIYMVKTGNSSYSFVVDDDLIRFNISYAELKNAASKNLEKDNMKITLLSNMLGFGDDGMDVYVCTNNSGLYGATSILRPDMCLEVSDKLGGSDIYILPSSVHEVLAVPCDEEKLDEYANLVKTINGSGIVSDNDILTNSIYKYSRVDDRVTIAKKGR